MTSHSPTIVVATDLTEASEPAIRQAHALAVERGAHLTLVHVMPDTLQLQRLLHAAERAPIEQWDSERKLVFRAALAQLQEVTGRTAEESDVVIVNGSPHAEIIALAAERHATLVVVAASAKTTAERWLLGSTAEEVVRHAHCPVMVVRPSPDSGVVLAATDLSDMAIGAIDEAVVTASRWEAPLAALYCLDVDRPLTATFNPFVLVDEATRAALHEAAHETLKAALAGFDATGETLVVDADPKRGIAAVATEKQARLVVVGTHGASGATRFLLGSVALAVARSAPCSVLVARHESQDK